MNNFSKIVFGIFVRVSFNYCFATFHRLFSNSYEFFFSKPIGTRAPGYPIGRKRVKRDFFGYSLVNLFENFIEIYFGISQTFCITSFEIIWEFFLPYLEFYKHFFRQLLWDFLRHSAFGFQQSCLWKKIWAFFFNLRHFLENFFGDCLQNSIGFNSFDSFIDYFFYFIRFALGSLPMSFRL